MPFHAISPTSPPLILSVVTNPARSRYTEWVDQEHGLEIYPLHAHYHRDDAYFSSLPAPQPSTRSESQVTPQRRRQPLDSFCVHLPWRLPAAARMTRVYTVFPEFRAFTPCYHHIHGSPHSPSLPVLNSNLFGIQTFVLVSASWQMLYGEGKLARPFEVRALENAGVGEAEMYIFLAPPPRIETIETSNGISGQVYPIFFNNIFTDSTCKFCLS
ncbi:hypothetical protein B0H11DRAFT_2208033 [Mycena galericulata]|nr:hypothetical protein B0H11DRAFT_2208033 [Mycena galericulata]